MLGLVVLVLLGACKGREDKVQGCSIDDPKIPVLKLVKGKDHADAGAAINRLYPNRCGLRGVLPVPGTIRNQDQVLAYLKTQSAAPRRDESGFGWIIIDNIAITESPELTAILSELRDKKVEVFFLQY